MLRRVAWGRSDCVNFARMPPTWCDERKRARRSPSPFPAGRARDWCPLIDVAGASGVRSPIPSLDPRTPNGARRADSWTMRLATRGGCDGSAALQRHCVALPIDDAVAVSYGRLASVWPVPAASRAGASWTCSLPRGRTRTRPACIPANLTTFRAWKIWSRSSRSRVSSRHTPAVVWGSGSTSRNANRPAPQGGRFAWGRPMAAPVD